MRCGSVLSVRTCSDCEEDRPGSGAFGRDGTITISCKTRACASCAWVRARNTERLMGQAFDLVEPRAGYRWQFIVLTTKYDPTNPDDLTREALRSRAMLCARLARRAWEGPLKAPGAGMLRTTEVSMRGMVHANLIYFGPPVDKDQLDVFLQSPKGSRLPPGSGLTFKAGERAYGNVATRAGFCKVSDLDWDPVVEEDERGRKKHSRVKTEDPRGSKEAVKRASKYASKGLGHSKDHVFNEGFLADETTAVLVDEVLAARWEIAVYKLHLTQRYGALRGIQYEEHAHVKRDDDANVACKCCGVVGNWKTVLRRAEEWLQWCHEQGLPGLERSVWRPPREGPEYHR